MNWYTRSQTVCQEHVWEKCREGMMARHEHTAVLWSVWTRIWTLRDAANVCTLYYSEILVICIRNISIHGHLCKV